MWDLWMVDNIYCWIPLTLSTSLFKCSLFDSPKLASCWVSSFRVTISPTGSPVPHHPICLQSHFLPNWVPYPSSPWQVFKVMITPPGFLVPHHPVLSYSRDLPASFPHFLPRWLLHHSPPQVRSSVAGHHGCLFLTSHTLRLLCSSFPFSSSPSQCNFLQVSSDGRLNALCFWSLFTSDDFFDSTI